MTLQNRANKPMGHVVQESVCVVEDRFVWCTKGVKSGGTGVPVKTSGAPVHSLLTPFVHHRFVPLKALPPFDNAPSSNTSFD